MMMTILQMPPAPEPLPLTPPAPEPPEQTPLQLLQQQIVEQSQALAPTSERVPMSSSAENSLLLQIQALTEQLLATTAITSAGIDFGFVQPQTETVEPMSNNASSNGKVVWTLQFCIILHIIMSNLHCNSHFPGEFGLFGSSPGEGFFICFFRRVPLG